MLLDKIEEAGLELSTDGQYLDVTGEINDQQRDYFRANRQKFIVALRMRPIAEKHGHDLGDLLSWYEEDIEALYGKTDDELEIIVYDYIRNQGIYRHCKPVPHCVRCIDCQYFVQRDDHPHLGRCATGALQTAPGGFWDTHLRGCSKHISVS